jgi:hypothetical protein
MRNDFLLIFALICGQAISLNADVASVQLSVDAKNPGTEISPDFSGLSFEISLALPNENGVRYFRPDNRPLVDLFHTLGIKSLRIGGNTSDRDAKTLPGEADLDSLFAFAKAADVKVIYCLRLHNGDPQSDAATAKYIMEHFAPQMDCFSIGQEPSAYPVGNVDARPPSERMGAAVEKYRYESYRDDWKRFADAIIAAVPDVKFCGPSVHNNALWARRFIADFGTSNHVALITEHLYAGGAGGKVPTPEIGQNRMLSDDFLRVYAKLHDGFVPQATAAGLPYRLEEVNNYFNGGAAGVSNTFASALWGLDFMYWWAQHGAMGLNFHTGDKVAAGANLQPSKYTAFFSTTDGFSVRPLGYGIKAFDLGGHGRLVPVEVSNSQNVSLDAYAVLAAGNNLFVTVINKEHGENAKDARVLVATDPRFTNGEMISMTAPGEDVGAIDGITLGGARIENDAAWHGDWKELPSDQPGSFTVTISAASASILRMRAR